VEGLLLDTQDTVSVYKTGGHETLLFTWTPLIIEDSVLLFCCLDPSCQLSVFFIQNVLIVRDRGPYESIIVDIYNTRISISLKVKCNRTISVHGELRLGLYSNGSPQVSS
jgi:hypothetical protein